jgi:hypothetical protein
MIIIKGSKRIFLLNVLVCLVEIITRKRICRRAGGRSRVLARRITPIGGATGSHRYFANLLWRFGRSTALCNCFFLQTRKFYYLVVEKEKRKGAIEKGERERAKGREGERGEGRKSR